MNPIEKYAQLVEEGILRLGIDPKICRTNDLNKWFLHRGSADIVLFVRESKLWNDETGYTLVVVAPIVNVPEEAFKRLELYDYVMDMNHKFITESFSFAEGILYLSSTYYIEKMSEADIARQLDSTSFYAEAFCTELQAKYPPRQEEAKTDDK